MKHLELHIIQSIPVACLNRDDLNSPKTAVFGGVQRARVSSQSWKRAIREMAKEIDAEEGSTLFNGDRTRRMVYALKLLLVERSIPENAAVAIAEQVAGIVETLDTREDSAGYKKIKTVMFFSKAEYDAIAEVIGSSDEIKKAIPDLLTALGNIAAAKDDEERKSALKIKEKAFKAMDKVLQKGAIAKAIKSVQLKDAADIALFGRMVANDPSLKVDGASMFAHILSTHKADNEIDFFTAVDDLNKDESGAGMASTLEFNSATYYRFAALNLDELANDDHLGDIEEDGKVVRSVETRRQVVKTFLRSTIHAIPSARKTTMNGNTLPVYVLGIVRDRGHPTQLVNAFETPVRRSDKGYVIESINRMNAEYTDIKDTWGVEAVFAKAVVKNSLKEQAKDSLGPIETCSLDDLINGMVTHVI